MFDLTFWLYTKTNFTMHVAIDFFVGLLRLFRRIVMFCGETTTDVDNLLFFKVAQNNFQHLDFYG